MLCSFLPLAFANDTLKPVPIRLVPQIRSQIRTDACGRMFKCPIAKMPENFYPFGAATTGKLAEPQAKTLQFAESTWVADISSTPELSTVAGGNVRDRALLRYRQRLPGADETAFFSGKACSVILCCWRAE